MKKIILFSIFGLFLGVGIYLGYHRLQPRKNLPEKNAILIQPESVTPFVTVSFFEEDSIATYSNILATTVYEALQKVSVVNEIPLKTKQYDFGIFVEEIGNKPTLKDHAWLYFVNGISGDIAADKKTLKTGDSVEWRYMELSF